MTILDVIQKYWAIILFCGTVIAQWVRAEMKQSESAKCIEDLDKELDKTNVRVVNLEKSDTKTQVTLENINTNLEYIKQGIKELKDK